MKTSLISKSTITPVKWDKDLATVVPTGYEQSVEIYIMDTSDTESLLIELGAYSYTPEQLEAIVSVAKRMKKAQAVFDDKPPSTERMWKVVYENMDEFFTSYFPASSDDDALDKFRATRISYTDIVRIEPYDE